MEQNTPKEFINRIYEVPKHAELNEMPKKIMFLGPLTFGSYESKFVKYLGNYHQILPIDYRAMSTTHMTAIIQTQMENCDEVWVSKGEIINHRFLTDLARKNGKKSVIFFPDNFYRYPETKDFLPLYDFCFTSNTDFLDCDFPVTWMPGGFDPEDYRFAKKTEDIDLLFVGTAHPQRVPFFRKLGEFCDKNNYSFAIVGNNWQNLNMKWWKMPAVYNEGFADVASKAKICLNYHFSLWGVNNKCFEYTAAGSCLLTDNVIGINQLFIPDEEMVTYDNFQDLTEKIRLLLKKDKRRNDTAERGKRASYQNHTIPHRVNSTLSILAGTKPPEIQTLPIGEENRANTEKKT